MNISPINLNFSSKRKYICNSVKRKPQVADSNIKSAPVHIQTLHNTPFITFGLADKKQETDYESQLFGCGVTRFCRNDLNWQDLGEYLQENFENLDDVDIHCFGCSTGQEPYSFAILLKKYFNDAPFLIHASDKNENSIAFAIEQQNKKDGIQIRNSSFSHICKSISLDNKEAKKYFKKVPSSTNKLLDCAIVNSVEFKSADVLESLNEVNSKHKSIILCRNMWPYNIDREEYPKFAKLLYDRLAPGSIVIVGAFDYLCDSELSALDTFPGMLKSNGFTPVKRGANPQSCLQKSDILIFKKE